MELTLDLYELAKRVETEIQYAESFQKNIDSLLVAMKDAEDADYLTSLARGIALNRQMMESPLQRASVILELVKLYDRDTDLPILPIIQERFALMRERLSTEESTENHSEQCKDST